MSDDVQLCVEILEKAIAFEEEGMRFFTERAENAPSVIERNIFKSLAKDEAGHRAYLMGLRDDLVRTHQIEVLRAEEGEHRPPREIFVEALANVKGPEHVEASELEILRGALEVERRGYTMYKAAADKVDSQSAQELFLHLAAEEQNHYQLLHNTYEYLSNPEAWHGYGESPMLDGA